MASLPPSEGSAVGAGDGRIRRLGRRHGAGCRGHGGGRRSGARRRDDRPGVGAAAPPAAEGDDGERRQDHGRQAEGRGPARSAESAGDRIGWCSWLMSFVCGLFDKRDGESGDRFLHPIRAIGTNHVRPSSHPATDDVGTRCYHPEPGMDSRGVRIARGPRMTTARDRPPEEAAEDTSFARGLRLLLTVADRGEVRADELEHAARHAALDGLPLPPDARATSASSIGTAGSSGSARSC